MTVLWVLAHHDDEYLALPMMLRARERGETQRFVFLTDSGRNARWRQRETRALLRGFGVDPDACDFVGDARRVPDGALSERLDEAFAGLREVASRLEVSRIVTPAWEGGHPDHDSCALLAVALREGLTNRPPIEQFSLYHGKGRIGPVFRACAPLEENGPTLRVRMDGRRWRKFARSVWRYPSQADVWLTLWPSMFLAFIRRGFQHQSLETARVFERPHAGKLLYERTRRLSYAAFRARADAFVARSAPGLSHLTGVTGLGGDAMTHDAAPLERPLTPELAVDEALATG